MKDNNYYISYLVVGGHGGQALIKLWLTPQANGKNLIHNIFLNVVDNGGSTGVIGEIIDGLPVGDFRNNWANIMESININGRGKELSDIIQKGLNNENLEINLNNAIGELISLVDENYEGRLGAILNNLDSSGKTRRETLNSFIQDVYLKGYRGLDEEKKLDSSGKLINHKVGNIFLAGLAHTFRDMDVDYNGYQAMLDILKEVKMIPPQMNFTFIDTERKDLCVIDKEGRVVMRGEGVIDEYENPIDLNDLKITEPNQSVPYNDVSIHVVNKLLKSDFIVMPPGSEGNKYPWLVHLAPLLESIDKPTVHFVNFAKEPNSQGVAKEIFFLASKGLKIKHLFSDETGLKISSRLREKYEDEGKTFQLYNEEEIRGQLETIARDNPEIEIPSIEELAGRCLPTMQLRNYNGILHEASDDQEIWKGLRHSQDQVAEVCIKYMFGASESREHLEELK